MTIYDIAREAGVAASTVSRVINNKPGIKTETRRRVQELLKKYNYIPDAAARAGYAVIQTGGNSDCGYSGGAPCGQRVCH